MATDFDAYRALGLERSAPPALVEAAYEQMRLRYRDDPARLTEAATAYELLRDPDRRREYDERHPAPAVTPDTSDLSTGAWPEAIGSRTSAPSIAAVPWTLADMLRALILPAIFVALNIVSGFTLEIDEDDLTTTDYVVNFGFGFLVEGLLFFLAYWFTVRKYKLSWSALGFRKPEGVQWWFPIALLAAAYVLIWLYALIVFALGINGESNVPEGAFDDALRIAMLAALSIGVAPLVEETFFRGFLYQGFARRYGPWAAIGITAAIFGTVHLSTPESFLTFVPIACIGAVFAWGVWRSKSIVPSIIAHLIFNATTVLVGVLTA